MLQEELSEEAGSGGDSSSCGSPPPDPLGIYNEHTSYVSWHENVFLQMSNIPQIARSNNNTSFEEFVGLY